MKGFEVWKKTWKSDLVAALSVALVALPLSLGIASASDMSPAAGIFSALAGGFVATFLRGSAVAINGPANSLIVVMAAGVASLADSAGPATAWPYIGAAVVLAGLLQVGLGLLRVGNLARFVPPAVINGMLAGIGVMICAKQLHVAVGHHSSASSGLGDLLAVPASFAAANPLLLLIAVGSLVILFVHPRIKTPSIHYIPAPLLVLLYSVPIIYWGAPAGKMDPKYLVSVPDQLWDAVRFPSLAKFQQPAFWSLVFTLVVLASLESLLSCKAVDRVDPFKRQSDLNQELIGTGAATMVSGALGGLPVATVIARSSVNVNHGGKSGLSNLAHAAILLVLVSAFPHLIQEVPLAALAAILIYTGYKLASPKVFRDALHHGPEQLAVLLVTLLSTLVIGLLPGILVGLLTLACIQAYYFGSVAEFCSGIWRATVKSDFMPEERVCLKMPDLCNFLTLSRIARAIALVPQERPVLLDFSSTRLIDSVALEYLKELEEREPGHLEMIGLGLCEPICAHPQALRCRRRRFEGRVAPRLSLRQKELMELAQHHHWSFRPELNWVDAELQDFEFFRTRPFEYRRNRLEGSWPGLGCSWEVMDVIFDEGLMHGADEHHMTVLVVLLNRDIPGFTLCPSSLIDRLLIRAGVPASATFRHYPDFPSDFLASAPDPDRLKQFLKPERILFFQEEEIHHVESNGSALLIFDQDRLLTAREVLKLVRYGERLAAL